jgi:hypothetical protein
MVGGVRTLILGPLSRGFGDHMATVVDLIPIKIQAQNEFVRDAGGPLFAPPNGVCWSCHRQIYDKISLEQAGSSRITGCPHCRHSFCE